MQNIVVRKKQMLILRAVALLAMMLMPLIPLCQAWGATDSKTKPSPSSSESNPDQKNNAKEVAGDISPVIVKVSVDSADKGSDSTKARIALDKTIRVTVRDLTQWMKKENVTLDKLVLFIDGVPFRFGSEDNKVGPGLVRDSVLVFDLRRDEQNKDAWTRLLGRKVYNFLDETRTVPLTVGLENGAQAKDATVTLVRINEKIFKYFPISFVVFTVLFAVLAIRSDILRDSGGQPNDNKRKTYSLARTQMALWFVIITVGYIFIWMVTSDIFSLTEGVFGLMGISSATALGSIAVDSNKHSRLSNQRNEQTEKRLTCEQETEKIGSEITSLNQLKAAASSADTEKALSEKTAELASKMKEIEQLDNSLEKIESELAPQSSDGWYKDLFCDDEGISLHRVQIAVWTLLLMCIFIIRVANTLTMPQFDPILLALMGISGGTYVGFKLPEKQG